MNKMTWIALSVVAAVLLSMAVFCPLAGKCPMHLFQETDGPFYANERTLPAANRLLLQRLVKIE
ncbi:MAG TPA: hypothetical protein EYN03_00740 [Planctomycetes bacterium]|nr:hypothetical protein [Planctomycetota bacterium]